MLGRVALVGVLVASAASFATPREVISVRCLQRVGDDGEYARFRWVGGPRDGADIVPGSCHVQRFRRQWGIDELVES